MTLKRVCCGRFSARPPHFGVSFVYRVLIYRCASDPEPSRWRYRPGPYPSRDRDRRAHERFRCLCLAAGLG
jgi:hypothetical protein